MNRTKYPMNDGEESGESGDDESESDDVYVFLTSSGNHDDTGGTFVDADDDALDDESVDDDFASFLENMLNIELEADAGGFEFANDIFGCLLLLKNAKYYYIILFKYNNILYKNKLNVVLYIERVRELRYQRQYIDIQSCHYHPISKINSQP
jgi:hypothetical protein